MKKFIEEWHVVLIPAAFATACFLVVVLYPPAVPKTCPPINGNNHIAMEVHADGSYRCVYQQSVTGVVLARSEKK